MNKFGKISFFVFITLVAALPLFAQEKITVYSFKGPSGVGMVRLFDQAPLVSGYEIRAEALGGPDIMVAKFLSGEAKIGILPPNIAAKLAAAGKPLQVAAVVGNGMLSLLSDDASLNSLQSLRGKKIEVAGQGATPDYVFRRLLQNAGLDPQKDVELGYSMAYPEMAQALIAGRVSIALLPEPFATMARMGRKTLVDLIDVQKEWAASGGSATYPMTVLVVDSRFAKEHPLALKAIMDAYRSSVEWTKKMPKEAGLLVEKYELGLKSPIATAAIPKSAYVFIDAIEARPSLEALFSLFLASAPASIGGKLPSSSFYLGL